MTGLPAGDLPSGDLAAITSEPMAEVIAAIADRYGVRVEAVREVPGGVANHAFALGDDLFLRIPRREEFERDLQKEVAVIPVARAAVRQAPPGTGRHHPAGVHGSGRKQERRSTGSRRTVVPPQLGPQRDPQAAETQRAPLDRTTRQPATRSAPVLRRGTAGAVAGTELNPEG